MAPKNELNFWRDGYRARMHGYALNNCPWPMASKECSQWCAGWYAANRKLLRGDK